MLKSNRRKKRDIDEMEELVTSGLADELTLHQYYDAKVSFDPNHDKETKIGKVECCNLWSEKPNTVKKPIKYGINTVVSALYRAHGIKGVAARSLGVTRATLSGWINTNETLMRAYEDAKMTTVDYAESKLLEAIEQKKPWAIQMLMRFRGDMIEPTLKGPTVDKDEKGAVLKAMDFIESNPELTPKEKRARADGYRKRAVEKKLRRQSTK